MNDATVLPGASAGLRLPIAGGWIRRPTTRGECEGGPRPCPWHTCRHHLGENLTGKTCTLDVADDGPKTLEEIARILGVTRERVRQIAAEALLRLQAPAVAEGLEGAGRAPPPAEGRDDGPATPPEGETMGTKTNGLAHRPSLEIDRGEAIAPEPAGAGSPSVETASLVGAFGAARAALEARREALVAELAAVDEALRGAPSRIARVLDYLEGHPGASSSEIGEALAEPTKGVATALCALRRAGRARSTGEPPSLLWSAT